MKRILLVTLLCSYTVLAGCTNRYQYQVDQSLLLQENRRLEEALYVTHSQLVELKRENESLRIQPVGSDARPSSTPLRLRKGQSEPDSSNYDEAPRYENPQVTIPENAPESNILPDALKGTRVFPKLYPPKKERGTPLPMAQEPRGQEELVFPELPPPQNQMGESTVPIWTPTR